MSLGLYRILSCNSGKSCFYFSLGKTKVSFIADLCSVIDKYRPVYVSKLFSVVKNLGFLLLH
jgi:hypothetical protein